MYVYIYIFMRNNNGPKTELLKCFSLKTFVHLKGLVAVDL